MTDVELQKIRDREAKATAGPWYAHNPDDDACMNVYCVTTSQDEPGTFMGEPEDFAKEIIALTLYQSPRVVCHESGKWDHDAEFIAHARTDIPALLAEIERLRGAMLAQDNRERAAGERCGIPYAEHGCDWPEAAADEIDRLNALVSTLSRTADAG